jgi:uncharacterized membrane protein HdeD (DUF308 family)
MTDRLMTRMKEQAPWRKGVGWPVIAIEGLLLLGLGIFVLVDEDTARDVIFQIIGLVLLVTSVLIAQRSLRFPSDPMVPYTMLRAGIGGTIGVIAIMRWWSDYLDNHAIRLILGWGLIGFTIVHLAGLVVARGREGLQVGGLLMSGLTIVLGIILLTGEDDTSGSRLSIFGTILIVFGGLLLAFAFYLYRSAATAEPTTPGPEDAQASEP